MSSLSLPVTKSPALKFWVWTSLYLGRGLGSGNVLGAGPVSFSIAFETVHVSFVGAAFRTAAARPDPLARFFGDFTRLFCFLFIV